TGAAHGSSQFWGRTLDGGSKERGAQYQNLGRMATQSPRRGKEEQKASFTCDKARRPIDRGVRPMFGASGDPMNDQQQAGSGLWHATTIVMVRKGGKAVIGGDGQVSLGQTIIKGNAKKVRRLAKGEVVAGFAGATADAFTLFERLEAKLEQYPGQLARACVELAKDWRTDRYLRRLEAMMLVADKSTAFTISGAGGVVEPEAGEF